MRGATRRHYRGSLLVGFLGIIYIYVWFVVGLSWRCGDWLEVDDLDRYLLLIG